jgi:hypothetical protein
VATYQFGAVKNAVFSDENIIALVVDSKAHNPNSFGGRSFSVNTIRKYGFYLKY